MVVRKAKRIRKVIYDNNEVTAAQTDESEAIHTMTDPGTTKRLVFDLSVSEASVTTGGRFKFGLCITPAGATVPSLDNVAAEENRWLYYTTELHDAAGTINKINKDMKIQRKVKDGDVLSCVIQTRDIAYYALSVLLFIDET